MLSSTNTHPNIVVLGSGVLGLSIATELVSKGHRPVIVAKDLADDVYSTGFASPWAGCNWYSFAADDDLAGQEYDRVTYERLRNFHQEQSDLCEMIPFFDVWDGEDVDDLWFKDVVPDYKRLKGDQVPLGFQQAITFKSFILHAPNYIAYLTQSLKDKGVPFIKHRVSSLDEAYALPLPASFSKTLGTDKLQVDLVINATGLGAKSLLGVQDDKVYPIRGQTVLVRSKYASENGKRCYMGTRFRNVGLAPGGKPKEAAYIIPRPGPSNEIILGGTFLPNEWNTLADPATAERILQDCFKLNPDLAGPPEEGKTRSWKDIEVISHNVGLRPARQGGVRVELEERSIERASLVQPLIPGPKEGQIENRTGAVVHAYGIGPAGYQSSWGIAEKASELADEWLKSRTVAGIEGLRLD